MVVSGSSALEIDMVKREGARLYSLIDQDPERAIQQARALLSDHPVDKVGFTVLAGSVLIDAGAGSNNRQAIEQGVALFRGLNVVQPEEGGHHYNLANGLSALVNQEKFTGAEWYLATASLRHECRSEFQRAILSSRTGGTEAVAFTNLGNALALAHRWVEAYDAYLQALSYDSSNAIALTGAARILLRCLAREIGEKKTLTSVAARHIARAKAQSRRIPELAGPEAEARLAKLLKWKGRGGISPDLTNANAYERFVAQHRLALSLTIEGLDRSLSRWTL